MGADLCGYWLIIPEDDYKQILADKLALITDVINANTSNKKRIKSLQAAGVDTEMIAEITGIEGDATMIAAIKGYVEIARLFDLGHYYRDQTSLHKEINGKNVTFMFCGEMSWGDSPDGAGHEMLETLDRLGFWSHFSEFIDWGRPAPKRRRPKPTAAPGPTDDPQES